jgi:crotonobetainyl-CoA:carnitine CoA-transferase CaiB-like acyl-CoA transferase
VTPPLSGLTIVSIEQAVAAPFATRQLADLGARVIKIERPDGGDFARGYDATVHGLSSYFVWLNRSKQSLTLDVKAPVVRAALDRLLDRADVFVQNLAPGATDRLGLAPADVRRSRPRLIVCNVSGYGASGPFADKKAYDLLVQGETGALSTTGTPDAPSKIGISIADIAAGMYAYSAILTALLARSTTGVGATIDVSLFDALGEWMSAPMYYTRYGGTAPTRSGADHASIAPYGPFVTGDGDTILLGIQNSREWTRFCADVLRQPDLTADPRFRTNPLRVAHRAELGAIITGAWQSLPTGDVRARLDAAGIAHARQNDVADFASHPQLADRDRWARVHSPAGPLDMLKPPAIIDGVDPVMGPIPALGAHTAAILGELGIDADTAAQWKEKGLI